MLIPCHVVFVPRLLIVLMALTVLSHTAKSEAPGATPPTQDAPRLRALLLSAFEIFAADAPARPRLTASAKTPAVSIRRKGRVGRSGLEAVTGRGDFGLL